MKNRIILFTFIMQLALVAKGQSKAENVVREFGENMQSWILTGSPAFYKNLFQLCNGEKNVRVYDELCTVLFNKHNYPASSNELPSYLNCIEKEMANGISIKYSNFSPVSPEEVSITNLKDLEFVSCDITVSGSFYHHSKDLFYIRKGKISKIDKCEEVRSNDGKKKIKVDLSDIDFDEETFGITYNYSKHFPIGASLNYAIPWWLFGVDFGMTLNADDYIIDNVEMTDIMNFRRTKTTVKPRFFMTGTVALNLKYVAIGCGVGFLYFSGNREESIYTESSSTGTGQSIPNNESKFKPILRPTIKGFVPFNDDWALSLNVDYNYVFDYKDLNGISFGIGMQYTIDY